MSPQYRSIQPLSFEILPDTTGLELTHSKLMLPDDFKSESLIAFQRQKPNAKRLPIRDLNRLVRLILPDVYSIDINADKTGKNWLRAVPDTIDPRSIRVMLYAWINAHDMKDIDVPSIDDLQWVLETTQLNNWSSHPNGTTKANDDVIYDLLPNFLARAIVDKPLLLGGNPLFFYQVAKDPDAKGVEMISWPPLIHKDFKEKQWFYSYLLKISVATIPFISTPRINIYLGIRRWISTYHPFLPNERLSVYIRTSLPYLNDVKSARNFQVITAKIKKQSDIEWNLTWSDRLPEMLSFLKLNPPLLDPEKLRKNPLDFLKHQEMPNIAMVYSNRISGVSHEVATGVSPSDRHDLLESLVPNWDRWLKLVKPNPKIKKKTHMVQDNPFQRKAADYKARWARLQQQHKGSPINIEIHYQNDDSCTAMLETLGELLGIQTSVEGIHKYEGVTVTIHISTRKLGAIGAELRRRDGDSLREVAQRRREEVVNTLGLPETTTIALVEILTKEQYVYGTDPKQTLRSAFAHAGRLTQFFNPMTDKEIARYKQSNAEGTIEEPKIPYRFYNTTLDALRQLGVHTAGHKVENRWILNGWGWNIAGYWLVRQSSKKSKTSQEHFLPTLVVINGETGLVYAWAAGLDLMYPYHEVLLLAGQGKLEVIRKHTEVAIRLPQDLERIGLNQDVVLVIDTTQSNMRYKVWRWLQDQKITPNEILFNDGQKWLPSDHPKLRVVRVRSVDGETPEWYAKATDETVGLSAGVHSIDTRTFVSISQTATTQQFSRSLTKTNTENASKQTPSPGYYELTIGMMQPHDDAEYIAGFVHALRDGSMQYQDETSHTLPLHLGKLIEEYLLWIEEQQNEDVDPEDEEE